MLGIKEEEWIIHEQPRKQDLTLQPGYCAFKFPRESIQTLLNKCPAGCSKEQWKQIVLKFTHITISPAAAMGGFQGGIQGAQMFPHVGQGAAITCGLISWLSICVSFMKGFSGTLLPQQTTPEDMGLIDSTNPQEKTVQDRCAQILSGTFAAAGAAPSFALLLQSCDKMRDYPFSCLQGLSFRWVSYLFASSSAIANCSLGATEAIDWFKNARGFYNQLLGETSSVEGKDKPWLIITAFIVAYLAITSLIGYVPPLVSLVSQCAPSIPVSAAYCGSIFASGAECMYMTNMMLSQQRNPRCCNLFFTNPMPEGWTNHHMASTVAIILALACGFSMASFTYEALLKATPLLRILLTSTAWTGGFWTTADPGYTYCTEPFFTWLHKKCGG